MSQPEQEVHGQATWAELFFDLVLAFAVTQTAHVPMARADWHGVAQAILLLAIMWWSWVGTTLAVHGVAEDNAQRLLLFGNALCVFVMAIVTPSVFTGHDRPVLFAGCHLALRAMLWDSVRRKRKHAFSHWWTNPYTISLGCAMVLLAGAVLPPGLEREGIWWGAVVVTWAGPALLVTPNHALQFSAAHLPERFATFVIVALGETVASTGTEAAQSKPSGWTAPTVALVFLVGVGLWWVYFNNGTATLQHALLTNPVRGTLVRDLLSYGHFVIVCGLILTSVGARTLIVHPMSVTHAAGGRMLPLGVALYIGGFVFARWRISGAAAVDRAIVTFLLAVLTLTASLLPQLVVLSIVAALLAALNGYEYWIARADSSMRVLLPQRSLSDVCECCRSEACRCTDEVGDGLGSAV